MVALAVVAGGAWVLLDRSGQDETAPVLLADLPQRPRLAWHFDVHDHLDELGLTLADIEVVGAGVDLVTIDDDRAVAFARVPSPQVPFIAATHAVDWTPRLFGIDVRSGEVRWTSPPLWERNPQGVPRRFNCWGGAGGPVCLQWRTTEDPGGYRIQDLRLMGFSDRDGSIAWEVDAGSGGTPWLAVAVVGDDVALVLPSASGDGTVTRYASHDGSAVWSASLPLSGEVRAAANNHYLVVTGNDFTEVLDAETGESLGLPNGARGEEVPAIRYTPWVHGLLRVETEHRSSGGGSIPSGELWQTITAIDGEGTELWSVNTPHYFTAADPGAPLLFVDDSERSIVALDPISGEYRWERPWTSVMTMLTASSAVVILAEEDMLVAVDPETGEQRWRRPYGVEPRSEAFNPRPRNARLGEEAVYFSFDDFLYADDLETGAQRWSISQRIGPDTRGLLRTSGPHMLLLGGSRFAKLE